MSSETPERITQLEAECERLGSTVGEYYSIITRRDTRIAQLEAEYECMKGDRDDWKETAIKRDGEMFNLEEKLADAYDRIELLLVELKEDKSSSSMPSEALSKRLYAFHSGLWDGFLDGDDNKE